MKMLGIIFGIMTVGFIALLSSPDDKQKVKMLHTDGEVDSDMTGPEGQQVLIGTGGGRYYIRKNRKVYVGH